MISCFSPLERGRSSSENPSLAPVECSRHPRNSTGRAEAQTNAVKDWTGLTRSLSHARSPSRASGSLEAQRSKRVSATDTHRHPQTFPHPLVRRGGLASGTENAENFCHRPARNLPAYGMACLPPAGTAGKQDRRDYCLSQSFTRLARARKDADRFRKREWGANRERLLEFSSI